MAEIVTIPSIGIPSETMFPDTDTAACLTIAQLYTALTGMALS